MGSQCPIPSQRGHTGPFQGHALCPDPCSCSCVPGSHSSKPVQADGGTHPLSRFFPSSLWESAKPSPQILALLGGRLPGTYLLTAAVTSMVGNAGPSQAPAVSVQESKAPLVRGSGCQCVMALLGVPRLCPLALVLRACGTSNTLQVFWGGEEGARSGSSCC